ncbi:MAG: hypothetical protein PHS07_02540 [Patescibacteria group bacterium]|nr:hypothetical protein [Patescibacteria group bacterium]
MTKKTKKTYVSVAELAKIIGISRIAVFKRIKKEQIPAEKIGHSYVISMDYIDEITKGNHARALTEKEKREIQEAVERVINEYSKTLQLLGKE